MRSKVVLSKSTTLFQMCFQSFFIAFQTTTMASRMSIRIISTCQSKQKGRTMSQSISKPKNVRSLWFGWFHTHLKGILQWFFWLKICENSCFWWCCSTSIATRKFLRCPSTTWWVWKIIHRHRALRKIKNHIRTTSQSKVMDGNVNFFHFSQEKKYFLG